MSNRDFAKTLIDQVPENKLLYAVYFLQGMIVPDETPNSETLKAIAEVDQMIQNGSGEHFTGSTADFFTILNED